MLSFVFAEVNKKFFLIQENELFHVMHLKTLNIYVAVVRVVSQ